jgi:hypothetical protein
MVWCEIKKLGGKYSNLPPSNTIVTAEIKHKHANKIVNVKLKLCRGYWVSQQWIKRYKKIYKVRKCLSRGVILLLYTIE